MKPFEIAFRFLICCFGLLATVGAGELPVVMDKNWQLELVVSDPQLVTPIGCCFDKRGRLLIVESHTHFPSENYSGPKTDRIYVFKNEGQGTTLDQKQLFYEGGQATMGVTPLEDDWMAIVSRGQVIRVRDRDGDLKTDDEEVLLRLETTANYPHNGLTGLCLGPEGWLYVGQGENLGEPYELIGSDGSRQVGGGEGGNIFRCRSDGSRLERVATGFWNPFTLHFDSAGRLWTVGNDPDAMPPCRLLHVVPTGDYGFQFRFGRAGTHPLQSWNGEFPGTLPMVAGTGEAPCTVLTHEGRLWVTSWGDNRIERYKLVPNGASWKSELEVVVQGGSNFRPVGMAVAPDGSIYFTDWVQRSYPVHGEGKLWRLSRKNKAPATAEEIPPLSEAEQRSRRLCEDEQLGLSVLLESLHDEDAMVRQGAIAGLVQTGQLIQITRDQVSSPLARVALLAAWRWKEMSASHTVTDSQCREWIGWGLKDKSPDVVRAALRWAAERQEKERVPSIRERLNQKTLSPELFATAVAAIAYLETGSVARGQRDPAREQLLVEFASNPRRSASLRALAIRMLPRDAKLPTDEQLSRFATTAGDHRLGREVVRLLSQRGTLAANDQLAKIAENSTVLEPTRADAVSALSKNASRYAAVINKLATPRQPEKLRQEARRVLRRHWGSEERPSPDDLDAWDRLVGTGGDVDAGRRVFFRATCANCHSHSGRGSETGPDLTTLSGNMTSGRLIESILHPSKEIGPLYVPWRILTTDGKLLTGLKLNEEGAGHSRVFQGADGMRFEVPLDEIEEQSPLDTSIMPSGLVDTLSIAEFRDLVAFLIHP